MSASSAASRLRTIARAVISADLPSSVRTARQLRNWIAENVPSPDHSVSYLVLAVLHGRIPHPDLIKAFTRSWSMDGLGPLLDREVNRSRPRRLAQRTPVVVESGVVIDVTDTSRSRFTTGIQRVARETIARWDAAHELTLVAWDRAGTQLRSLTADEESRVDLARSESVPRTIIPFRATLVLPEITTMSARTARLRTIARFGGGRSVAIGFDCIPVTTAETAGAGMPGAFSKYLSTLARFDAIAPISFASAQEYSGWRRMLSGAGLSGPDIHEISLPFEVGQPFISQPDVLRDQLGLDDLPMVLSVGSHEPRKNHLNLLQAAEMAWQAGKEFTLVLVGGNSWDTNQFDLLIDALRRRGRRVIVLSGIDDNLVWQLYTIARFSVFCSINEGFGLPVVESIACGTPVITSNFGSMKELGEGKGALLADPHDVGSIATAFVSLLEDSVLLEQLRHETLLQPKVGWDEYASELWALAISD